MRVKLLEGGLVNGYRSINVLGLGEKEKRGILYHRLFSSQAPGFVSKNDEVEKAISVGPLPAPGVRFGQTTL